LLLNIDVFEKRLPSTTTGSSANVFRCDGHFGLIFRSPSASEEFERNSTSKKEKKQMLEGSSVDFLIRNLFATQKLGDLLTARLNVALNVYAGELDAAVKSLVEDFALDALVQVASSANRDLDSQSTGSFLTPDAYISQLERTVEEIKAQKKPLKDFQESWKVARNRQETALQEFPAYFRKELIRFLVEESSSNPSATSAMDTLASQSIKDVLTWIDIRFMVTRFEFTPAALDAEKLVSTKVAVLTEQLQAAVQKLTEARHSRQSEILDVLKGIITAITADTRTMATQRGIALAGSIAELISGTGKGVNRSQLLEQGPALIAEYHNLEAESKGSSSASPATNKEPRQRAHLDVDDQDGTLGPN
jgi:hypothetical protein